VEMSIRCLYCVEWVCVVLECAGLLLPCVFCEIGIFFNGLW